jgi:hypothetical protein
LVTVASSCASVGITFTVALAAVVPPALAQLSVKVVLAARFPVEAVPLFAFVPVHPPVAVHEVAPVDVQVSVDALPLVTVVGLAAIVTVGFAVASGVAEDAEYGAPPNIATVIIGAVRSPFEKMLIA